MEKWGVLKVDHCDFAEIPETESRIDAEAAIQKSTREHSNQTTAKSELKSDTVSESAIATFVPEHTKENVGLAEQKYIKGAKTTVPEFAEQNEMKSQPDCNTEHQMKCIKDLGLTEYFPNKLTFNEVMYIADKAKDVAKSLHDVPILFLRKIMMLDSSSRDNILTSHYNLSTEKVLPEVSFTDDIDLSNIQSLSELDSNDEAGVVNQESSYYSPLDVFLSIFICLHPTLQQKLYSKMFTCRLAVPLIYCSQIYTQCNDLNAHVKKFVFIMWPLRGITVFDGKIERPVITSNHHVISFVRFGRPSISKSKTANKLLHESAHNTFFNYDCSLGSSKKYSSLGVVEAAWFLPSEKETSRFPEVSLFLNLRGDATDSLQQIEYLTCVSHIIVVFTDQSHIQSDKTAKIFKDTQSNLVFVVQNIIQTKTRMLYRKFYETKVLCKGLHVDIVSNGNGGISKLTKALSSVMVSMLSKTKPFHTLQREAGRLNFIVDEESLSCVKGKQCASDVFCFLQNENLSQIKEKHTPLQMGCWKTYTDGIKKYSKATEMTFLDRADFKQKLEDARERKGQNTCTSLLKTFIKHLECLHDDVRIYFLDTLEFLINDKCMRELPTFRNKYNKAFYDFQNTEKESAKEEVVEAERILRNANFGIEHIFRELGQLFETKNNSVDRIRLSKLVANLVIEGYPLELMDGEVGNIPKSWIKQIFEEMHKILQDKRILTLSILGLQSSGKSTLLNTMFGLNFAVSAGRCTSGIFLYLLPFKGETEKIPFDYVLVVDTEGLRAPELGNESQKYHDNELAALVIGMADISIVNIKGEIASDITDVLQICVHTFMQLQQTNAKLKLKQSCIFVHQNVPAQNAKDAMSHARNKTIETLNQLTQEAALMENVKNVRCFSDMINFDSSEHIWYFSDLWNGDPPMAPANIGYSNSVQNVKSIIFQKMYQNKSSYRNINDIYEHIENLWDGILANDFILNFTNTLELKAYAALEKDFQALIWDYEQLAMLEINIAENKIKSSSDLYDFTNIKLECTNGVLKKEAEIKQSIDELFKKSDTKDYIERWRSVTEESWENIVRNWQKRIESDLDEKIAHQRVHLEYHALFSKKEYEIQNKAKDLAESMKGEIIPESEIDAKFNDMWDKWASKLNTEEEKINIEQAVWSIMSKMFKRHLHLISLELNKHSLNKTCHVKVEPETKDFSVKIGIFNKLTKKVNKLFRSDYTTQMENESLADIRRFQQELLLDINTKLNDLKKLECKFNEGQVKGVLMSVTEIVNERNKQINITKYQIHESYTIKMSAFVCCSLIPILKENDEKYHAQHSMKAKLKHHKKRLKEYFRNVVGSKSDTFIALDILSDIIRNDVTEEVKRKLPFEITKVFVSVFHVSKRTLIREILTDIAEDSDLIIRYARSPYHFAFMWLTELVDKRCFDESLYADKAFRLIKELFQLMSKHAKSDTSSNMNDWLTTFENGFKGKLLLDNGSLNFVRKLTISDISYFSEIFLDKLTELENSINECFRNVTRKSVKWHNNETPYSKIMDKLWGCKQNCPFCGEPCQGDLPHIRDYHTCLQHRPDAVIGGWYIDSNRLSAGSCSFHIQSEYRYLCGSPCKHDDCTCKNTTSDYWHKYTDYQENLPKWSIIPSADVSSSYYWAWVLCTYNKQFAKYYDLKEADIPLAWNSYTKEDAIKSLSKEYGT